MTPGPGSDGVRTDDERRNGSRTRRHHPYLPWIVGCALPAIGFAVSPDWPVSIAIVLFGGCMVLKVWGARHAEQTQAEWDARRAEYAALSARLIAEAEPRCPTDDVGTCPHCDTTCKHLVLGTEALGTRRRCVFCKQEWLIDHSEAGRRRPMTNEPDQDGRERMDECVGCLAAASASRRARQPTACGLCGHRWKL
jgi:hypothetical protein